MREADHDLTTTEWKQEFIDIISKWFGTMFKKSSKYC